MILAFSLCFDLSRQLSTIKKHNLQLHVHFKSENSLLP